VDHLHPRYRGILKEYLTDGRNYLSSDGRNVYQANAYYHQVEADIQAGANKLPLTVSGDVAWVAAQTGPRHLRLTLIDSGYMNPHTRTARVTFHTVEPTKLRALLTGMPVELSDPARADIDVPCGLFRFIDIELARPL